MNIHMLNSIHSSRAQLSKREENSITPSQFKKTPRDKNKSPKVNNTTQVRIVVTQRNNQTRNLSVAGDSTAPELAQVPDRGQS